MSIPQEIIELIETACSDAVSDEEMFTALDISRTVQSQAKQDGLPLLRHNAMKEQIHFEMQQYTASGEYTSELRDVGASSMALLYFPETADPNQYKPRDRSKEPAADPISASGQPTSSPGATSWKSGSKLVSSGPALAASTGVVKPATPAPVPTTTTPTTTPIPTDDDARKVDGRGSLVVPANLVVQLDVAHGGKVEVWAVKDKGIFLAPNLPSDVSAITSYTVDHNNNVRLTQWALLAGQLDVSKGFQFDMDSNLQAIRVYQ